MNRIAGALTVAAAMTAIALVARGRLADEAAATGPPTIEADAGAADTTGAERGELGTTPEGDEHIGAAGSETRAPDGPDGREGAAAGGEPTADPDSPGSAEPSLESGPDGTAKRSTDNEAAQSVDSGDVDATARDAGHERDVSAAAQMPSPDTVLERTAAAYEDVRSLRADFVQRLDNTLLGTTATSRGTIYQRRPDRFLMRFTEPAGDVIVGDGEHFWIYYPSIDEAQVIRTPMGAGGAGGVDLQAQFLGDPSERFDATLEGTGTVDGREALVLTLDPRQPLGYEELKVWVDREDHLVRRFEIREPNGVIRRIELNGLSVNPTLADSLFEFTPPPGARIVDRG